MMKLYELIILVSVFSAIIFQWTNERLVPGFVALVVILVIETVRLLLRRLKRLGRRFRDK
jgi:hypothetical protein